MIVMDCCAAMEIAEDTEIGNALFMLTLSGEKIIAPYVYFNEISNVAWKHVEFGNTPKDIAKSSIEKALALVDEFVKPEEYYVDVFTEACECNHPAYDFFYLLLAKRTGATLFTVDKKLADLCEEFGVETLTNIDI